MLPTEMFSTLKRRFKPRFLWSQLRFLIGMVGVRSALGHFFRGLIGSAGEAYWIQPKGVAHPMWVRRDSSDILVLGQIFDTREYRCLDRLSDVQLVIDCGANVGYSSAYFLSQHSGCQVVAIEPDRGNFAMLQRNLAPYGERVQAMNAGVWSQTARLVIAEDKYRDGREWSKQVRVCEVEERASFDGLDLATILAASGRERISLLKMDIEGAEAVVFAENYQPWLEKVDTIAIELHADSSFGNGRDVFFAAISGQGFECSQYGDLTICQRPEREGPSFRR